MPDKPLRNGYTTGSCAAAAAGAAAACLFTGVSPESVAIRLPGGQSVPFAVEAVPFRDSPFAGCEPLKEPVCSGEGVCFRVQKDAGDDPDITDGSFVYAYCSRLTAGGLTFLAESGRGYLLKEDPPLYVSGGPGIGLVTREGLPCPVGRYAINPGPRAAVAQAVRAARESSGAQGPLLAALSIPGGEKLAEKTFNPRLGVAGGLSVLGTTGIVKPMSEDALMETVRLELHMRAVTGRKSVILTPGSTGETFLEEKCKILKGTAVLCSNFVKDAVTAARDEGFQAILFAGHIGKLIKVAAGMENTHSRYGDRRMDTLLSLLSRLISVDGSLKERLLSCATTEAALQILDEISVVCPGEAGFAPASQAVLDEAALAIRRQLAVWAGPSVTTEVIVFSSSIRHCGVTEGAYSLAEKVREGVL